MIEANGKDVTMEATNKKPSDRVHKVGTLTLGLTMVAAGVLFLLHTVFDLLSYTTAFRFWPVIFIAMGIEILLSNVFAKKFIYDGGAVAILILMSLLGVALAGSDLVFQYMANYMS